MKRLLFFFVATLLMLSCNSDKNTYAIIETDMGNMKVLLYDSTPKHKANFIKLAKEGFYDDLLFHRVIKGFMVQGGDPQSKGAAPNARLGGGGPGYMIDAEIGAPHVRGALAAARTGGPGNPEKKSSGSQFYVVQGQPQDARQMDSWEQRKGIKYNDAQRDRYIQHGGRPDLDMEYTVFGEVVEGIEVVDKIAEVATGQGNRPVEDVKMKVRMVN